MKILVALLLAFVLVASVSAGPVKVGGNEQAKKILNKVTPVYPPEAKEKGIEGQVFLEALIAEDGTVKELKVLSGPDVFIPGTIKAVKQWTYEPTMLNGKATEVITEIHVNYTLSK